jgi:hypothetical protein
LLCCLTTIATSIAITTSLTADSSSSPPKNNTRRHHHHHHVGARKLSAQRTTRPRRQCAAGVWAHGISTGRRRPTRPATVRRPCVRPLGFFESNHPPHKSVRTTTLRRRPLPVASPSPRPSCPHHAHCAPRPLAWTWTSTFWRPRLRLGCQPRHPDLAHSWC